MVRLIHQLTVGIVRDKILRRKAMLASLALAGLMIGGDALFLSRTLAARPGLFLLYWFACAWLTLLSILLALYDVRMLRKEMWEQMQREQAKLREVIRPPED